MEEIVQPSLRDSLISAPSRPGPGDTTNVATWLEHLTSNVKEVEQELAQGMFTVDDDHIKSLNTLTEFNDDLVVLTIASGFKGECAILHSFVKVDGPSGPTYYALNGLYKQSQVVQSSQHSKQEHSSPGTNRRVHSKKGRISRWSLRIAWYNVEQYLHLHI